MPPDFCIPLPAAVVELAALDQRSTPLDRMTCIYDTVHQVGVHIRQAVLDTHGDSNDISSELNKGKLKLRYCEKAPKFEIKNLELVLTLLSGRFFF